MSLAQFQFRMQYVLLSFALLHIGAGFVVGEGASPELVATTAPSAPSPVIQYRRIYVPFDKIDVWPREKEKLIPIESREFDELIRSIKSFAANREVDVTISAAEYWAQIDGNGTLRGTGRWTISHHGVKTGFLSLGSMSLVLQNLRWSNLPHQPVRIGSWGASNQASQRFGLEVPRSGTLEFDFHISVRGEVDQVEIPWQVPTANSNRLTIDLPDGKQPKIEGGVVLESSLRPPDDKTPTRPLRRWVFAVPPAQVGNLQITNSGRKSTNPASQIVLDEDVRYQIGPRGLELTASWNLRVPKGQKRELAVVVPAGLQLSSIQASGDTPSWRLLRDASMPTDTAIIDLPKNAGDGPIQITFNAWQPLVLGVPWRLPRLRPEGVFWSSGKLELAVSTTHELTQLVLTDCVEAQVGRLNASESEPETHSFIAYTPSATLEVMLSERLADTTVRSGTSLVLADPNLDGRLVSQFTLSHGATHQLLGNVAPGWIVEALETIPADAMTEWFIDKKGSEKKIEVQLARAASASQDIMVIVTARLQRFNLNEQLSADTLRMIHWVNANTEKHLLAFQSGDPYTVVPVGKVTEVARNAIGIKEQSLLDSTSEGKIYDLTNVGQGAGIQFALQRGQFSAHLSVEGTYENESLRIEYQLTIEPASGPIDRLLVYSTHPLGDSTRWFEKTTNQSVTVEKLPATDPQRAQLPKEGELWSLRFAQPISHAIELVSTINLKRLDNTSIPLLYFPEATQQDATLAIRSRNASALWLEPTHVQIIPAPPRLVNSKALSSLPAVCAAYRYQPTDCLNPTQTPRLVATINRSDMPPLVARNVEYESFFWPDGKGTHRATYYLDGHSAAEVTVALPSGSVLSSASLDDQSLDIARTTKQSRPLVIHLPGQTQSSKLSLFFETRDPALTAGRELSPPSFASNISFVSGNWTVFLPEEFSATGGGLVPIDMTYHWRERLFGVLGRPAGSPPFNPFRLAEREVPVHGNIHESLAGKVTGESGNKKSVATQDTTRPSAPSIQPTTTGWVQFNVAFIASAPAPVVVLNPPAITVWAIALMFACFMCGVWIRRKSPTEFAIALAAASISALMLPVTHINLASGAVLGLLLSLIANVPWREVATSLPDRPVGFSSISTLGLATLAIALAFARFAYADVATNTASHESTTTAIHRLFIPTDEKGKPTGSKYFLSDEFLRVLVDNSTSNSETLGQWILSGAKFNGELRDSMSLKSSTGGSWVLTFAIETLSRDTTIILPFIQSEADWNPTAMLGGIPLPLEWRDSGQGCALQIPEPGQYALSISCTPKTTTVDGLTQIDLTIPPIAGTTVEIRYPESVSGVSIANALNNPGTATEKTFRAELGRTNRLIAKWSHVDKSENSTAGLILSEMRWLHVTPTALEVTIKCILEGSGRRPDSLVFEYDSQWSLLSNEKPINGKSSGADSSRQQRTIRVPLASQTSDRQEVVVRWRLEYRPRLGNFRLPPITLMSAIPSKRWLAISSSSEFDCSISDSIAVESTSNEFFSKWGTAEIGAPPQTVLANFDSTWAGSLSIRPHETEPMIDESLSVLADIKNLRVSYEMRVTPGMPGIYRIELSVPSTLTIDDIVVTESDQPVPLRWSRNSQSRVSIFLGEGVTKPYRLVLNGKMVIDANGKASLPRISSLVTEGATQKVYVYRSDNTQVDFEGLSSPDNPKAEAPGPAPSQWAARPVGTCYIESGTTLAKLLVKSADTKVSGDALTSLSRESNSWWMNYRCQLTVDSVDLDLLRFRVPNTVTGPFEIQSADTVVSEFKPTDGQTGTLTVRFANAVSQGKTLDLRIRSPLKPPPGEMISMPSIGIDSLTGGRRYLAVPETVESQVVTWSEAGVRPTTIPLKLRTGFTLPSLPKTFEVIDDPFQVIGRSSSATKELEPSIRLADTVVAADRQNAQRITTRLIIAPHGLTDCILQLPPQQSLIMIEIDGRPAMTRQLDRSQWQLALGARHLPQAIEIISRQAATTASEATIALQRPTLIARGTPLPTEISLWSFTHPRNSQSRLIAGVGQVTAEDQAALRFDRLVSIAEAAKATALELSPTDGYNWLQPWTKLLLNAREQARQTKQLPPQSRIESQVSRTAEEQINSASTRLDKWLEAVRQSFPEENIGKDSINLAVVNEPLAEFTSDAWTHYVAEGGKDRLVLYLQPQGFTPDQARILGIFVITALLVTSLWLLRQTEVVDACSRWPHALGVLIGIGYWAWMWPSWLGLVIVVASLWMALRFHWPSRIIHTEASTVLRNPRSTQL